VTAKDAGETGRGAPVLQGRRFEGLERSDWQAVLRDAFEYRGDVTVKLDDGSVVVGYLFAHEPAAPEPHVKLYPASVTAPRVTIPIARIVSLEFSGDDKASGRSWEAWVKRYEERKRLLAEGRDPGAIEPMPEELG
jgi:hypothetical protein